MSAFLPTKALLFGFFALIGLQSIYEIEAADNANDWDPGAEVQGTTYDVHNFNPHLPRDTYGWGIAKNRGLVASSFTTTTSVDQVAKFDLHYVDIPIRNHRSTLNYYIAVYRNVETATPEGVTSNLPISRLAGGEVGRSYRGVATGRSWNGYAVYRFFAKNSRHGPITLNPNTTYWVAIFSTGTDQNPDLACRVYMTNRVTEGRSTEWHIHGHLIDDGGGDYDKIETEGASGAVSYDGGETWSILRHLFIQMGLVAKGDVGKVVSSDSLFISSLYAGDSFHPYWERYRLGAQELSWLSSSFDTDELPSGYLYALQSVELDTPTFAGNGEEGDPVGLDEWFFVAIATEKPDGPWTSGPWPNGPGRIIATLSRNPAPSTEDTELPYSTIHNENGNRVERKRKRRIFSPFENKIIFLKPDTEYYVIFGDDTRVSEPDETRPYGINWEPVTFVGARNRGLQSRGPFHFDEGLWISHNRGSDWSKLTTITNNWRNGVWESRYFAMKFGVKVAVVHPPPRSSEKGDFNFDNRMNLLDLITLNDHLAGQRPLPLGMFLYADLNSDNEIDGDDRRIIINRLLDK